MGGKGGIHLDLPRDLDKFIGHLHELPKFPFRKCNADIANSLRNAALRRFKSQTDKDGNPWEPSARAEAEGGKTLSDTGRLKSSITTNATTDEAEVGTNVVYARIHELGGEEGKPNGSMPKRSYLDPSDEALEIAGAITDIYIKKIFPEAE